MLILIAKKDFLERLRDGRWYWAGGIVLALLISALAVGSQYARTVQAEQAAGLQSGYQNWLSQGEYNPHAVAHHGIYVYRPQPALALIDPGIDPYVGSTLWLEAHKQNDFSFRPAQDALGLQRFGALSGAWVLQIFVPLLIIILGFDAFAGERERGTLRQALSQGIASRTLLWGKSLSLAASLTLLLIPAGLLMLLVGIDSETAALGDTLVRLFWIVLAYAIYLGIFIFLTLAVSARASSSRMALLLLLAVWIANGMVAPRAASDLARHWFPTPSRFEFNTALRTDLDATTDRVLLENFKVKTYGELPTTQFGAEMQIEEELNHKVFEQHYGELWDTFAHQQRFQEWSGLVAPLLAVRAFSMGLAGTDFFHHRDFAVKAEELRRVMVKVMNDDLIKNAGAEAFNYRTSAALWSTVPPLDYHTPPARWALLHNWQSLAILFAGLIASLGLALAAMRRVRM